MLIKTIRILDTIQDVRNDCVDISIHSEDDFIYTICICTPKYLSQQMKDEKTNFINPNNLFIIVRELTSEIITETIEAYAEDDAFWLKLNYFSRKIDMSVFDKLQAESIKESIEIDLLGGLEDLEDEINKLENLSNIQKSKLRSRLEKLSQLFFRD